MRASRVPGEALGRRVPTEDLVRAVAVSTSLGGRWVLHDVDVAVRRGEIFVVMGPSGCGKTTLLKHLNGLLAPTVGSVYVAGRDLYRMPPRELRAFRRRSGTSFQGGALLGSITVLENVELPIKEATDLEPDLVRAMARLKLEMVGLLHAAHQLPAGLSGGMRKRAAVARALALDPEILFFDEPSAGLDPVTAAGLDNLIVKLNRVFGITMVVVTHDLDSAFGIADRIAMILQGRVVACGRREEIRSNSDARIQDFVHRRMPEEAAAGLDLSRFLAT